MLTVVLGQEAEAAHSLFLLRFLFLLYSARASSTLLRLEHASPLADGGIGAATRERCSGGFLLVFLSCFAHELECSAPAHDKRKKGGSFRRFCTENTNTEVAIARTKWAELELSSAKSACTVVFIRAF